MWVYIKKDIPEKGVIDDFFPLLIFTMKTNAYTFFGFVRKLWDKQTRILLERGFIYLVLKKLENFIHWLLPVFLTWIAWFIVVSQHPLWSGTFTHEGVSLFLHT